MTKPGYLTRLSTNAKPGLAALAAAALVAAMGLQSVAEASWASADNLTAPQDGSTCSTPGGRIAGISSVGVPECSSQVAIADRATGRTQGSNPGTNGQCTWGAAQKWFDASGSYPAMRGDAMAWRDSATAAGWTVVDDPQDRSIVVFQPGIAGADGYGHVAWVDSVSQRADGQWIHVTEMNNASLGGVGVFNGRDVRDVPGMSYILLP